MGGVGGEEREEVTLNLVSARHWTKLLDYPVASSQQPCEVAIFVPVYR